MTCLTISQVIEGFLLDREAQQHSPSTIAGYKYAFAKLLSFLDDDVPLATVTTNQVRRFLNESGFAILQDVLLYLKNKEDVMSKVKSGVSSLGTVGTFIRVGT